MKIQSCLGVGDQMEYVGTDGKVMSGIILNVASATLMDSETGTRFKARKFYVWNDKRDRGVWTCAMRATEGR